jgi:DNA-binding MarR family transcriptional regulator
MLHRDGLPKGGGDARPGDELIVAVLSLGVRLLEGGGRLVEDLGLTPARWQVLGALSLSPAPLTVPQIARNLGLARQSVQRLVDLLEAQGFVRLEANPHHRRAKLVVMTREGVAVYRRAERRQRPWAESLVADLPDAAVRDAIDVLRRLEAKLAEP